MTQPKATLFEMSETLMLEADGLFDRIKLAEAHWPHLAPDAPSYRKTFVLRSAGLVLAAMAPAEDQSRKFIAKLMAEQRAT